MRVLRGRTLWLLLMCVWAGGGRWQFKKFFNHGVLSLDIIILDKLSDSTREHLRSISYLLHAACSVIALGVRVTAAISSQCG